MSSMGKRMRVALGAGLACVAVLAVVALVLGFGLLGTNKEAGAATPATGVDFHIGVELDALADILPGNDLCTTVGNTADTCDIAVGSRIRVNVYLDSFGTLTGYQGIAATLNYAGVTAKSDCVAGGTNTPGGAAICSDAGAPAHWPSCAFEVQADGPGFVNAGCAFGISAADSTYTGRIISFTLNCTADGTVALGFGQGESTINGAPAGKEQSEAGPDSLTVNCQTPTDTPTATLTATPSNTPDASPTPTPNPNPKMEFDVPSLTCNNIPPVNPPVLTCSNAQFFGGAAKRGEFQLEVDASNIAATSTTYYGFETQIDLGAGLSYNSQSCAAEVVWIAPPAATCSKTVVGQSVRLGGRTSAGPPFTSGTQFEGTLVRIRIHCASAGTHALTLKTTAVSNPGAFFVLADGSPQAAKPGNSGEVDIININCNAQTPEMSLSASGPRVTCVSAPTPPTPADPNKPDKCIVPFETAITSQTPVSISVRANVIPANAIPAQDGYGGFDTNVYWAGLRYPLPKPSCLGESVWPDTLLCQQGPAAPITSKQHHIQSGLFPPFAASHHVGELLRMDLTCPSLGQFRVILNASGTQFINPLGTVVPVAVATVGKLDPLTPTPATVTMVDSLLINCAVVPTSTPTGTPTSTATPTATPCPTVCPTATFTATVTPTPTNTSPPTNTPLPPTNTFTPLPPTNPPTITQTPTPCCGFVNVELPGPGKVTTDTDNNGATGARQVETSVTIVAINGGKVTIQQKLITQPDPAGFDLFGQQVNISAPNAIAISNPNTIVFTLDVSIVPAGQTENTIQIFRNGTLVPNCGGAPGSASPNPCVTKRHRLTGAAEGDLQFTVLTTSASAWNFGTSSGASGLLGDVNCDGQVNPLDAQFILQLVVGLLGSLPCPQNADVDGNGDIDSVDALLILQLDAGIIDDFPVD